MVIEINPENAGIINILKQDLQIDEGKAIGVVFDLALLQLIKENHPDVNKRLHFQNQIDQMMRYPGMNRVAEKLQGIWK